MRQLVARLVVAVVLVAACWAGLALAVWILLFPFRILAQLIGAS